MIHSSSPFSYGVKSIAIRAGMIYAGLACMLHPVLFSPRGTWFGSLTAPVEQAVARFVGLSDYPLQSQVFFRITVALLGAFLWRAVDRKRDEESMQFELLLVELRFVLAASMIGLGFTEVLHLQMPWPSQADWIRPIREMPSLYFVPVWMGSAWLHETVLGLIDLSAGSMLLFRRTTTLGAMLAMGNLANATAILLAFDDIRTGSYWPTVNFLLFAVFLVLADGQRILDFFFFDQRATEPAPPPLPWAAPWMKWAERFAKPAFVSLVAIANWPVALRAYDTMHHAPIAGVYTVEQFVLDGQSSAPPEEAGSRWLLVAIDNCRRFAVRTVDGRQLEASIVLPGNDPLQRGRECTSMTGASAGVLTLEAPQLENKAPISSPLVGVLKFSVEAPDTIGLDGKIGKTMLTARLHRIPDTDFLLNQKH
jgi:hypothetical protein